MSGDAFASQSFLWEADIFQNSLTTTAGSS